VVIQADEELMDGALASIQEGGFPTVAILWPEWCINEDHTSGQQYRADCGSRIGIFIKNPWFNFLHGYSLNPPGIDCQKITISFLKEG